MTDSDSRPTGRITDDRLRNALAQVQALTGLPVDDAKLIKFTNNAVYALPAAHVVVRIAGSATMADRVEKVVRIARWLEAGDVPAVRLLDIPQPLIVDGLRATLWHLVPRGGPPVNGADLATIMRQWHDLQPPDEGLPTWDPAAKIRSRLAEADGVTPADLTYLHGECDRLEDQLNDLRYELPRAVIHGDVFMGNLIDGTEGAVISDFDACCMGPREWDLTPMAVGRLRFDYAADDYTPFADTYGFDVTAWPGFGVLRRLREFELVTSLVPVLGSRPVLRPQWQRRLTTYRDGDTTTRWTTYTWAA